MCVPRLPVVQQIHLLFWGAHSMSLSSGKRNVDGCDGNHLWSGPGSLLPQENQNGDPPGQLGSCILKMQSYYQPRAPVTAWQCCLSTWRSVVDYYCQGLPQWLSGKETACQCRRCRFDPWVWEIPWRREWQPTTIFLPGKPHGQRSLAG